MSRRYAKRTRFVAAPVAVTSSVEQHTGQKNITLRGREFVADVVVNFPSSSTPSDTRSSEYKVVAQRISPTDANLFSWLTAIAEKFEEYKFYGMAFTYEPQCTTNTTGCVGIYFDPDPTNTPPQTWATFTNTGCNSHGATWAKHQLIVPRSYYADRKQYYVADQYADAQSQVGALRTPGSTVPIDPLEYFPGSVGVATVGVLGPQSGYLTIGKLYLDYIITLSKATIDTVPRTAYAGVVSAGTVAPTGKLVSPYFAQNAGTGMYVRLNSPTPAPIWGVSVQGTGGTVNSGNLPTRYGDELWEWGSSTKGETGINALSGIRALQTQDLMFSVCLDGISTSAGPGLVVWHFENNEGAVSTLSNSRITYEKQAAGTGAFIMVIGSLHVVAGERISLTVPGTVSGTLSTANSKIFLTPYTWGLDV